MKKIKILLLISMFGLSSLAKADLNITCKDTNSLETCADLVESTLQNMGCSVKPEKTGCSFSLIDDPNSNEPDATIETDIPRCTIKSDNCTHATSQLFSLKEKCTDNQKKIIIPKNSGVHNGYWMGIWAPYSRVICKNISN